MKFTQFLRPDGRRRETEIHRSPEIEALANGLAMQGYSFEIEELSTGDVSMEVVKHGGDDPEVIAGEICRNGPEVPIAVDKMIRDAADAESTT